MSCAYIKTFAFQIDTLTNPRIQDFDDIVSMAREKKLNLIFNLMAENTECADSLVGKDLIFLMKQNRDLLMKRYNKNGVIVVDNLELVRSEYFTDQTWTTEHYRTPGRKEIAFNLANHLSFFYPEQFVSDKK
jgi:hypothetical protein